MIGKPDDYRARATLPKHHKGRAIVWKGLSDMVKRTRGTAKPKPVSGTPLGVPKTASEPKTASVPETAAGPDAPAPVVAAPVAVAAPVTRKKPVPVKNRTVRRLSQPKVQQELLLMMLKTGDVTAARSQRDAKID